jgi:hypothetical protein
MTTPTAIATKKDYGDELIEAIASLLKHREEVERFIGHPYDSLNYQIDHMKMTLPEALMEWKEKIEEGGDD